MTNSKHIRTWILWTLATAALLLSGCQAASPPPSVNSDTGTATSSPPSSQGLKVHFIDVGQGDSILAESEGHYMLIDAGENDQGGKVVSYLKNAGVTSLDYVIGTHPHSDHIGGLDEVLREFPADKVILPPVEHTTKTFEDVLDVVADKGMKLTTPKLGDAYVLGSAAFSILAPAGDYGDDLNNWSAGIRLSYKDNHFVLCGDAEKGAEDDIVRSNRELSADVLKVGHHGSSTSTSDAFLEAVSPSYGVIQCGTDNSYGHPHREVLDKLEKAGIQVLRTDLSGTLVAVCDGSSITWSSGASPQTNAKKGYILNTNTGKFHLSSCQSVNSMKKANRKDVTEDKDKLIEMGYTPCRQCSP